MKENIILSKTMDFSLSCIILYKKLQEQWEFIISKQLLRSATSIGANVREAVAGQSKKDFYSKVCISFKEAYESLYWLELLEKSHLTNIDISEQKKWCDEIIKILAKIKMSTEMSLNE